MKIFFTALFLSINVGNAFGSCSPLALPFEKRAKDADEIFTAFVVSSKEKKGTKKSVGDSVVELKVAKVFKGRRAGRKLVNFNKKKPGPPDIPGANCNRDETYFSHYLKSENKIKILVFAKLIDGHLFTSALWGGGPVDWDENKKEISRLSREEF